MIHFKKNNLMTIKRITKFKALFRIMQLKYFVTQKRFDTYIYILGRTMFYVICTVFGQFIRFVSLNAVKKIIDVVCQSYNCHVSNYESPLKMTYTRIVYSVIKVMHDKRSNNSNRTSNDLI